jgi:outer membrane receptor protein involved in Fe transport
MPAWAERSGSRRALLALALLVCGPAVRGDEVRIEIGAVDLESLLDLSVEAVTRRPERASSAAAAVFVVTAEDIRRQGFRTLPEVLASVPGLFAYPGQFPEVGFRGMGVLGDFTTRTLLMVDGHPLSNSMGADLGRSIPVPLSALQRVEVIKGPVGSVYGPSAFLGVINLVTTTGTGGSEVSAGGEAAQGALRAGEASAAWRGMAGPVAVLAAAAIDSHRGLDWNLPELNAAYGQPPGHVVERMDFTSAQNGYLRATWRGLDVRGGCGHIDNGLPSSLKPVHGHALDGTTCVADVSWQVKVLESLTVTPRVSYDHFAIQATTNYPDPSATSTPYVISGSDRWATAELRADWRPVEAARVDVGTTAQLHYAEERTSSSSIPVLASFMGSHYQRVNSWLLAELRLVPSLTLHGGVTLSNHSLFASRLTPKAAAVWQPTGEDTVKLMWSNGFRPPTLLEALYHDNVTYLANPDLKPETVSSLEAAYEHRFGGTASLGLNGFWNRYEDMISYQTVPAPGLDHPPDPANPLDFRQLALNGGEAIDLVGAELAGTLRWDHRLQAFGGLSLQRASASRPNFPELTGNLAVSTRALWRPLTLSARGTFVASRRKDVATPATARRAVPPTFSLGASASLEVPGVNGLFLEASVVNALDARNASPAPMQFQPVTEMPEGARTFRADVRWKF